MPNSNGTTTTNPAQGVPNSNGINSNSQQIPINHQQYTATAGMDMPQGYHPQQGYGSPSTGSGTGTGTGGGGGGWQRQFSPPHQGFFDPDIDDMFSNTGLRSQFRDHMRDPFGTFGSHFPQFGSLGRRRAGGGGIPTATDGGIQHDDFFERLPPEFRQLIPEGFGIRRGGSGSGMAAGAPESPRVQPQQQPQFYQTYVQPGTTPPQGGREPKTPPVQMRTVCDAAIQTEDPSGRSEVDGHHSGDNLNQHGLRNTVDMGVKAPAEGGDGNNSRSHSAPPQQQEQNYPHEVPIQQQQQQPVYHSQGTGTQRNTPPPAQQQQRQPPQFQKVYYPPPNQPQQQPAAPQTPGGSYVRTIPIFVEGRSEPLINHKDIPQPEAQSTQAFAQAKASAHAQAPQQPQQQQHQPQQQQQSNRPTPINTQQQPTAAQQQQQGPPPATPHTMDSINKIQDIQRDVLNLMTQVEKFGGTRQDKEYAYLDEMLTRNLLKLDTIDTQGKESIRLARKEAIKCIQASINVLEAKAEENAKTAQPQEAVIGDNNDAGDQQPIDVSNVHEPIPLPPPESSSTSSSSSAKAGGSSDNVPATAAAETNTATAAATENKAKEATPPKDTNSEATTTATTTVVTKSNSGSSAKGESVAEAKSE